MKNKLKQTMTALCAALILMGGFSVPAYAQGTAAEPPTEDATNDSNVVVEEPETPPLTPKGNATLVDDFGGNKQLITVTTKGGNYFYILIDRATEGEQTVHFLNQVDEADLMALTETGEATKKPEVCNCTETCEVGKVNTSCPVCATTLTGCTGKMCIRDSCAVSPIPFATMTNREWGQIGNNYLKGLFALGFQVFLIMICVGIYAVLVNDMIIADNLHSAVFSLAAYTVCLLYTSHVWSFASDSSAR